MKEIINKFAKNIFHEMYNNNVDSIIAINDDYRIIECNEAFLKKFEYIREEVLGEDVEILEKADENIKTFISEVMNGEYKTDEVVRYTKAGKRMDFEIFLHPLKISEDKEGALAIYRDISKKKKYQNDLKIFKKIFEKNTDAILVSDRKFRVYYANDAANDIFSTFHKEVIGKRIFTLLNLQEKVQEDIFKNNYRKVLKFDLPDGEHRILILKAMKIEYLEKPRFAFILTDITKMKEKEGEIRKLAFVDNLTGIYNRSYFQKYLKKITRNRFHKKKFALIMFDIDNFRRINDNISHEVGDSILLHMSKRLIEMCDEKTSLYRIGGDDFAFIIEDICGRTEAERFASKLLAAFEENLKFDKYEFDIDITAGILVTEKEECNVENLIKNAEMAMYEAKKSEEKKYLFFSEKIEKKNNEIYELENELRNSIAKNELYLAFQPVIDYKERKISSAEVLLRWNNEKFGNVPPSVFIPIAEKNGFINDIGKWVISKTCKILRENYEYDLKFSINASVREIIRNGYFREVDNILAENNICKERIELEVTETLFANIVDSIDIMKKSEFKFSIDDFGKGYSSLSRIKDLPISKIKIDKIFIDTIEENMSMVKAIILMAKGMGLRVVAEGVEKKSHVNILNELGCNFFQGYYFSKPLPFEEFLNYYKLNNKII